MKHKTFYLPAVLLVLAAGAFAQEGGATLRFDVLDESGNFYNALKASDIQIAGITDAVLELKSDKALEIMILIDASASQERMLPLEKKAAQTFIGDFLKAGKDKVSIASFTGDVALEQDLTGDFEKAKQRLGKIEFVPPAGYVGGGVVVGQTPPSKNQKLAGSTSIWDSMKKVLDAFSKVQSAGAQRAIILISDGVNTYGKTKLDEVVETSLRTKIPVYAIGIGDDFYDGVDKGTLKKIAEQTGGIAIVPKKKLEDLTALLKTVEQSLRSDYELSFTAPAKNPSEIKLEIVNPELRKRKLQIVQPKGVSASKSK